MLGVFARKSLLKRSGEHFIGRNLTPIRKVSVQEILPVVGVTLICCFAFISLPFSLK